jgi:hypothetical protein
MFAVRRWDKATRAMQQNEKRMNGYIGEKSSDSFNIALLNDR